MAREAKERMKDYRLRKLASERKEAESTLEFLDQPFCDWLRENKGRGGWDGVNLSLDLAGLPPFEIHNDDGPRSYEGIVEAHPDETYEGYAASIGQAENFNRNRGACRFDGGASLIEHGAHAAEHGAGEHDIAALQRAGLHQNRRYRTASFVES